MIIYDAELNDGIAEQVKASASVTINATVNLVEPTEKSQEALLKANLDFSRGTNENQPDLYYLDSILVTTGWNKNDDVFDRGEVWIARATPEDKPFNYEHDESDIIGHITANYPIDFENNILSDDLTFDQLPEQFHLRVSAVLYRHWEDEARANRMQKIIAEIPEGKWFVSMECLFNNFDYGVIDLNTKAHKIIARNHETAFLTKHLRVFGGSGKFNNYQVGRVLRGITFAGKGLVRNPANPPSIIIPKSVSSFNGQITEMEKVMSDKAMTPNEFIEAVADLTSKLEQSKAETKTLADQLKKYDGDATEAKINDLNDALAKANESIKTLNETIKALETAKTEADEALKAKTDEFDKVEAEMNKMKDEKAKKDKEAKMKARVDALTDAGLSEDDAETKAAKFENFNDEQFEEIVSLAKVNKSANAEEVIEGLETDEAGLAAAGDMQTGSDKTIASLQELMTKALVKDKGAK